MFLKTSTNIETWISKTKESNLGVNGKMHSFQKIFNITNQVTIRIIIILVTIKIKKRRKY